MPKVLPTWGRVHAYIGGCCGGGGVGFGCGRVFEESGGCVGSSLATIGCIGIGPSTDATCPDKGSRVRYQVQDTL